MKSNGSKCYPFASIPSPYSHSLFSRFQITPIYYGFYVILLSIFTISIFGDVDVFFVYVGCVLNMYKGIAYGDDGANATKITNIFRSADHKYTREMYT